MKVDKHVEVEVVELAMVTMEAFGKGIKVDILCRSASEKMSLKVSLTTEKELHPHHPSVIVAGITRHINVRLGDRKRRSRSNCTFVAPVLTRCDGDRGASVMSSKN